MITSFKAHKITLYTFGKYLRSYILFDPFERLISRDENDRGIPTLTRSFDRTARERRRGTEGDPSRARGNGDTRRRRAKTRRHATTTLVSALRIFNIARAETRY